MCWQARTLRHPAEVFRKKHATFKVTFGDPIDPAALPEGLTEKEKRRYILDKIEEFYRAEDAKDKAKYPLD